MRINLGMRQFLTIGLWVVLWGVAQAQQAKTEYLRSERGDAQHWTGLKWTPEEAALFGGMPRQAEVRPHLLVLRYGFYVSHYDAEKRVPLWVTHVVRSDASDKARGRTQGAWSRKDDKFTPDSKIVLYAKSRKLPFVTDASYVNANPLELPVGEKSYQKITRGHLASNVEMKSQGDPEEGLQSQKDSFSLANVVPQMQRHHAPVWAKLEDECLEAARRLGRRWG